MVRLALAAALLELPCSVFGSGFLALAASGTPAEVRAAIESGADVNEKGDSALAGSEQLEELRRAGQ